MRTHISMASITLLAAALGVAGCTRRSAPAEGAEAEVPTLDVTHWTDKTELFMEYPRVLSHPGQARPVCVFSPRVNRCAVSVRFR